MQLTAVMIEDPNLLRTGKQIVSNFAVKIPDEFGRGEYLHGDIGGIRRRDLFQIQLQPALAEKYG